MDEAERLRAAAEARRARVRAENEAAEKAAQAAHVAAAQLERLVEDERRAAAVKKAQAEERARLLEQRLRTATLDVDCALPLVLMQRVMGMLDSRTLATFSLISVWARFHALPLFEGCFAREKDGVWLCPHAWNRSWQSRFAGSVKVGGLRDAVDKSSEHDVILLCPGEYVLDRSLFVTKAVTFQVCVCVFACERW